MVAHKRMMLYGVAYGDVVPYCGVFYLHIRPTLVRNWKDVTCKRCLRLREVDAA